MLKKLIVAAVTLLASVSMALAAVNINTASESELATLPGIGPAKAKAIVDYRKANGGFKAVEDIQKVKGIGPSTFEKLKPQLAVAATTASKAPAAKK